MSLKVLKIIFKDIEDHFAEINEAIENGRELIDSEDTIIFDSPKTWRSFMNSQKLEILTSVARLHPSSVYQLAKHLGRSAQHVLKDCRELETFGFLDLKDQEDARKNLRPRLKFDYDFIRVDIPIQTLLPISEESMRVLDEAAS